MIVYALFHRSVRGDNLRQLVKITCKRIPEIIEMDAEDYNEHQRISTVHLLQLGIV